MFYFFVFEFVYFLYNIIHHLCLIFLCIIQYSSTVCKSKYFSCNSMVEYIFNLLKFKGWICFFIFYFLHFCILIINLRLILFRILCCICICIFFVLFIFFCWFFMFVFVFFEFLCSLYILNNSRVVFIFFLFVFLFCCFFFVSLYYDLTNKKKWENA